MSVSWPLAFGGAFQHNLTGVDNVRFISRIYEQDIEENLAFVEDFAELGQYLQEPVRTYSSGMRARLAFAISMIIEFDCFLIDEIGAVGDARFHDRCNSNCSKSAPTGQWSSSRTMPLTCAITAIDSPCCTMRS